MAELEEVTHFPERGFREVRAIPLLFAKTSEQYKTTCVAPTSLPLLYGKG